MIDQETLGEYRTADLYFAAVFKASGIPMIRTDREGRRIYFVFKNVRELKVLQAAWVNSSAVVNAQDYAQAIKQLKGLCHIT